LNLARIGVAQRLGTLDPTSVAAVDARNMEVFALTAEPGVASAPSHSFVSSLQSANERLRLEWDSRLNQIRACAITAL